MARGQGSGIFLKRLDRGIQVKVSHQIFAVVPYQYGTTANVVRSYVNCRGGGATTLQARSSPHEETFNLKLSGNEIYMIY